LGQRNGIKLRDEMSRLRAGFGYHGDAQGFDAFMRTAHPDEVSRTRADLGARIDKHIARIVPKLKDWFAMVPRAPFVAKPMPAGLEDSVAYGWYEAATETGGPGTLYYNGTPGRLLTGAASLTWHEGYPGHHFQYLVATASGAKLHPLARETWASFFSEGWAVYATQLANEMGVNQNQIDRYDVAQDAAFMTSRLAVDTGLNAMGWSIKQAHDYLAANAGAPDDEIASELRRYGCESPAQALGYQYGRLAIAAARARAARALGKRFDIRAFHTAILSHGELGAYGLNRIVDDLIAK
jgi:uncharacterized protein (DUF885 family)